jgi:hypothetical protein
MRRYVPFLRRVPALAIVPLLALVGAFMVVTPAHADRNCESPHCYSAAYYSGSGFIGMWSQIPQNYTRIGTGYGDSQAHINSESWLRFGNGTWIEAGLRNGNDSGDTGGCNCVAYDAFWADISASNHNEYAHIIEHTTPNGNLDTYEFYHYSGSTWDFYFNGAYNNYSSATASSSGNQESIGGEYQNTTCGSGAGWANNFDLYTQLESSSGNWFDPAWNQPNRIDPGCGFEGIHYSNGEYSWQKHAP